ncbi:TlpA family protein disulfide reductase [Mucilaginibacter myungsuensis]|uniref:TlpA family protein disulfide reductase n=2 Tax=Mucilaginibacter myungsuensis TaxID=649104 RepID=A0A929PX90_9SPHI|nr:TlpA family protein disulfide reductase [Mucilaginibacter myungsuensis]
MKKQWFKLSNLWNGLFFAAMLALIFSTSAKAWAIEGLMKVGLFQPKISAEPVKAIAATPLPDVAFKGVDGKTVRLSELKGKVVFINFWATWCPPCVAEMPSINDLYEKLKTNKTVVFLIVDADANFKKSQPFMAKKKFTMPLYQLAGGVPTDLVNNSIPTTTILDKNGRIAFHQEGAANYSDPKALKFILELAK